MVLTVSSEAEIENILHESSISLTLVVIDFFTTWCGPCVQFGPHFERLSKDFSNDTVFVKIDCDKMPEFAIRLKIKTLPTVKGFFNSQEVFSLSGAHVIKLDVEIRNNTPFPSLRAIQTGNIDQRPQTYLLKVVDNIINHPADEKYRVLNLSNKSVQDNLLSCPGVRECLLEFGFQEEPTRFYMKEPTSLNVLQQYRRQLAMIVSITEAAVPTAQSSNANVNKFKDEQQFLPNYLNRRIDIKSVPKKSGFDIPATKKFLQNIYLYRKEIDIYENIDLMNIVNALIGIENYNSQSLSKEQVLKKLLRWFKYEFFSWFNAPNCESCHKPYTLIKIGVPTPEESKWLANIVEVYQCGKCLTIFRFPRYNHPEKLLMTRTGRCGEWANCFSLILRTFINENIFENARLVHDWSDHVWCELYIKLDDESEPRWVHVDPCEGTYDAPLTYQVGWNKQITYVIGVSLITGDVQDVTWRYTNNFELTMSKRNLIDESLLIDKLLEFHKAAGTNNKLIIKELVSFLPSKNKRATSEKEMIGRTTGSLQWRQERGELGHQPMWTKLYSGQLIKPTSFELINKCIHIQYNCSVDTYYRPCDIDPKYHISPKGEVKSTSFGTPGASGYKRSSVSSNTSDLLSHDTDGWQTLAASWKNIKRKVEYDWQVVYLARMNESPPDASGEISWTVDISGTNKSIKEISVFASSAEFKNASVKWRLHSADISVSINGFLTTTKFNECSIVTLTAVLQSDPVATDSCSWQHSQLCRQKSTDFDVKTLQIKIDLDDI